MNQENYNYYLSLARKTVFNSLGVLEMAFEEFKQEPDDEIKIKFINCSLKFLLLVTHTEEGRSLFIKILEFAKAIAPEIADRYWQLYDEDMVNKRYFNITFEPS